MNFATNFVVSDLQGSIACLVKSGSSVLVASCLAASAEFAGRVWLSGLSVAAAAIVVLAADSQELERSQRPNREPLLQTAGAGVSWTLLGASLELVYTRRAIPLRISLPYDVARAIKVIWMGRETGAWSAAIQFGVFQVAVARYRLPDKHCLTHLPGILRFICRIGAWQE